MTEFDPHEGILDSITAENVALPPVWAVFKRSDEVRKFLSRTSMVGEGATVILNGEQIHTVDLDQALGTVSLNSVLPLGRRHLVQAGRQLEEIYMTSHDY